MIVIGAGIHGLCTAFALRRRGHAVTVLERSSAGQVRGGSHGATRITRSSYDEPRYVRLARAAQRDAWPQLSAELGMALTYPTPGVFFGPPDGPFGAFMAATLSAGVEVERIRVDEAARRFPLLRFEPGDAVLLDHTAGVLAAARALAGLTAWLTENGVELRRGQVVTRLDATPTDVRVETASATGSAAPRADKVVVAAGAWLPELLPEWRSPLTVVRQEVGYVRLAAPAEATRAGAFPVWARIDRGTDGFEYGLPEFARPGVKIARHRTVGPGDDPNVETPIDEEALLALARSRLRSETFALAGSEPCLYAVTPDSELRVERAAVDPRIIAIAACSGHGFKFGPLIGERAAELVDAT